MTMSKKQAKAKSTKKTTKKPTHAIAKKKTALAVKEPQAGGIEEFNRLSEPFRFIPWDPFRGFEWPVEIELPTRGPYADVIESGNGYLGESQVPGRQKGPTTSHVGLERRW